MNVYNLELVRNIEIGNYVTQKQVVLSVYCWHVLFFDIFFHNADVCIFSKTTALFNYIFIQDKSIVFTVSMKFCNQSDLAILNICTLEIFWSPTDVCIVFNLQH